MRKTKTQFILAFIATSSALLLSNTAHSAIWSSCDAEIPGGIPCYQANFGGYTFDFENGQQMLADEIPAEAPAVSFSDRNLPTDAIWSAQASVSINGEFASWGILNSGYTGSRALFNNNDGGLTTIQGSSNSSGIAVFDLVSIDISELINMNTYNDTFITFSGNQNGTVISQTISLDNIFGNETFYFSDYFTGVSSVWWDQNPEWHQFDNIVLDNITYVAPLPAALWLMITGLLGISGVAFKNRKHSLS